MGPRRPNKEHWRSDNHINCFSQIYITITKGSNYKTQLCTIAVEKTNCTPPTLEGSLQEVAEKVR